MIIIGYKKYNERRMFMAINLKEKELLIEEIAFESDNDWDKLCNDCSSLIREAGMTEKDIDDIVEKVKNGAV